MKHTIAYIKDTTKYRITYYHRLSLQPVGFTNLDFTNNKDIWCLTDGIRGLEQPSADLAVSEEVV